LSKKTELGMGQYHYLTFDSRYDIDTMLAKYRAIKKLRDTEYSLYTNSKQLMLYYKK